MSTLRVDRIEPYLSSSIDIVGYTQAAGGATTGSNVFVGNQTVTGSIDITGQFLVNGTPITGSGGGSIDTASFATTGSNVFQGNQNINGTLAVTASGGSELKVNNDGTVDVTSTNGFNIIGNVGIVSGGLNADGGVTASVQTNEIQVSGQQLFIGAGNGVAIAMGGNKLEISGSIDANGPIKLSNSIESTGKLLLKPDENDPRYLNVYNTAAQDTHITASGGYLFLGDDDTYVFVNNFGSDRNIGIKADNGIAISGSTTVTGSIDITGQFLVNGSPITGSGGSVDTGSLATTGSNTFEGNQTINGDAIVTGSVQTNNINAGASQLVVTAPQGAILAINGNKLEVSGSIEAGNVIAGGAVSASNGFSGDGSGISNVNAVTLDGLDSTEFATTGANTFSGTQTVSSASFSSNITPISINNVDGSGGMGQTKILGLSANPSNIGGPYSGWNPQPTLYGIGSSGPYQIAEFQSQGNYTDGTATFKKPLIVSGSVTITGDVTAANLTGSGGGTIDTGSFATTGSNEFVGKQGVTGSFEVSGSIILTGSLDMTGSATFTNNGPSIFKGDTTIAPITEGGLPGGQPGQIAFEGGKMWVYISGQWNEVQFVSAPPPASSFEFTMAYDVSDSGSACNGSPSQFYSDSASLELNNFLWTGPGLATKVSDGYYASESIWYQVTGGDGQMTVTGSCPSYYTYLFATSSIDSGSACSDYPASASNYYASSNSLGNGSNIYTDTALSVLAANDTYYSDGSIWYYQTGGAINSSDNCA